MDITYLGHSSFKIKTKQASLVTDPYLTKSEADIVTVSHDHFDHNAVDKIAGAKKIVTGPGEYEISGISILGYPTYHDDKKGEERGKNTIYLIEAGGINVLHLGDLGHMLDDNLLSDIGDVDVLMIPVGGFYTIGPKEASEIMNKIEPVYVIPMHYKDENFDKDLAEKIGSVEDFVKESGLSSETLPKLSIKKDDIIEQQSTKIVVLERK